MEIVCCIYTIDHDNVIKNTIYQLQSGGMRRTET